MKKLNPSRELRISSELSLPLKAATQKIAILAMQGAGKSNAAVVLAEEMYDAGVHWVAIDPKGDWWGMRSSADGKRGGLPIPIFGGRHGDVPIDPSAGTYLAELIVSRELTCILDLSEFTEGEKIRFLAGSGRQDGFAARLFRLKEQEQPPTHLFFEEADDLFPQKVMRERAKLLHDCSRLLLWGRQKGISGTVITQRSARLHKDVLTQTDTLIAMRTTSPQDRKAVLAWVEHHGLAKTLVDSLPSLEDGDAWVWSPNRLKLMKQIHFRQRRTFDSGATPEIGEHRGKPATLADVDLAAIATQMVETIERAKADDPTELRKKIADLERLLKSSAAPDPGALKAAEAAGYNRAINEMKARLVDANAVLELLASYITPLRNALMPLLPPQIDSTPAKPIPDQVRRLAPVPAPDPPRTYKSELAIESSGLSTMERRMLIALAQHPEGLTKAQVRLHADYADSGPVSRTFARLNAEGWTESDRERIRITKRGLQKLGPFEPLPTGARLLEYLLGPTSKLSTMERALLRAVADSYPQAISKGEARQRAQYADSGPVSRAFARLVRYNHLVSDGPSRLRASAHLFDY